MKKIMVIFISFLIMGHSYAMIPVSWKVYKINKNCQITLPSNIQVDIENGIKDITWKGLCKDGFASGKGVLSYSYNYNTFEKKSGTVEQKGKMVRGLFSGKVIFKENQKIKIIYYKKGCVSTDKQCIPPI